MEPFLWRVDVRARGEFIREVVERVTSLVV